MRTIFCLSAAAAAIALAPPAEARTSEGYPPQALEQGLEGTTAFRAWIGTDGRAKKCEIVYSSGHGLLDDATCVRVVDHGRFEPARDEKGRKIAAWYQGRLSWEID